jgi:hypothetical protein
MTTRTRHKETEGNTYRHRIPADEFEVELFSLIIREHTATWPAYRSNINYEGDGVWKLTVQDKEAHFLDFDNWFTGKIWLAEKVYGPIGKVAVVWEMDDVLSELGAEWNINYPPITPLLEKD